MRVARWGCLVLVLAVVLGGVTWLVLALRKPPPPTCAAGNYSLTPAQAQNAATIAGVGIHVGMPAHAVTVALATALQESKLQNLAGGDRDSAGLFQQRPSQGWGTYEEVTDPVHAATAFYQRLKALPNWAQLPVTEAAQEVQRSGAPDAYAQWEDEARDLAVALTGTAPGGFTCRNLVLGAPKADLVTVAEAELGTAAFTGSHDTTSGWSLATWLVANATRFGVDTVTFDGRQWTAEDGKWSDSGPADGRLTLHQHSAEG